MMKYFIKIHLGNPLLMIKIKIVNNLPIRKEIMKISMKIFYIKNSLFLFIKIKKNKKKKKNKKNKNNKRKLGNLLNRWMRMMMKMNRSIYLCKTFKIIILMIILN